jgi:predicted small secreted protein
MNKSLILLVAAALLVLAACNRSTVIKKSVTHNGDKMSVEVYAKIDGKKLHDYKKEFDVTGMTKEEKDAIARHVMDSIMPPDADKGNK